MAESGERDFGGDSREEKPDGESLLDGYVDWKELADRSYAERRVAELECMVVLRGLCQDRRRNQEQRFRGGMVERGGGLILR